MNGRKAISIGAKLGDQSELGVAFSFSIHLWETFRGFIIIIIIIQRRISQHVRKQTLAYSTSTFFLSWFLKFTIKIIEGKLGTTCLSSKRRGGTPLVYQLEAWNQIHIFKFFSTLCQACKTDASATLLVFRQISLTKNQMLSNSKVNQYLLLFLQHPDFYH